MYEQPNQIRVLIAEDQKVFQLGLQKMVEQSSAIELVGIVGNGREVVERVSSLMPDVVILDAIMPIMDGVQTAEQLTRAYPNVKIIFLSGSVEYERITSALKAGASGYLKKETLELDLIPAILAVNRDNFYFSPEIIPIIQEGEYLGEANENFLRQFQLLPNSKKNPSWLETWELSLAKEIISKWRFANPIEILPHQALALLELDSLRDHLIVISSKPNNLITKLKVVVNEIERVYSQKKSFSSESLNDAKLQTQSWFDEVKSAIQNSAQKLRLIKIDKFNKLIAPYWQEKSPESLISFFDELIKLLLELRNKYERNRVSCLGESNNASKAFTRLCELVDERDSLIEQRHLWSSAFRAISIAYEQQLESLIYDVISQTIVGLIYCSQSYYDSLIKTNNLLKQVQNSLLSDLEPTLNSLDSKSEIEVWIGHRLNQWGNSPSLSSGLIRERLLSKIALVTRLDCPKIM